MNRSVGRCAKKGELSQFFGDNEAGTTKIRETSAESPKMAEFAEPDFEQA
jgi:hypothetical protein